MLSVSYVRGVTVKAYLMFSLKMVHMYRNMLEHIYRFY
jgi:hypothetical protein